MKKIGIIKKFDKLDRLVIPKILRDRYGIQKEVEIIATDDGILIRSPEFVLVRASEIKNSEDAT